MGCYSAFWALLSLARGFIRQHVAWSRSAATDVDVVDLSFGLINAASGSERSDPEAASVWSGRDGVSMPLPTGSLKSLQPDVVSSLVHLYHSGIIHQDLTPQNVLITKELSTKSSDMGISRLLPEDTSSSDCHVTDCESSDLQVPEQLCNAHQTCSVNVFGLDSISFFCITGKCNGDLDGKEEHVFSQNEGRLGNSVGNDDAWMNLKKPVGGGTPGWIGKLFVSNTEIAKGSKGTIILEGFYEGRPVAVKRLVRAHHDVASQEKQSLTASDQHPNIVRLHGAENDQEFVYLALERCACSLDDLIRAHSNYSGKSVFPNDSASNAIIEYKIRLDSVKGMMQDVSLWREDGHPSPLLLKLMRDVVSGLVHLHSLGIIHQDLKPQSVLITKELCAKLSDMGDSKLLPGRASSSGCYVTDCGSSGLQVPEQLCPALQTCSVDVFGLGCILFFCITGGRHPFGDGLKSDSNMEEYTIDLSPVEFFPEAADLLARLLNPNPNLRPKASEVLHHPLFWNSKMRLSFLRDISDWIESRIRGAKSDLLEKLESIAQLVFDEKWKEKIDRQVIKHQRRFRVYKFKRVSDLLRIVRNTFSHYRELPPKIQEIVGSSPEDLDSYFAKRFPRLLIETYRFVSTCCEDGGRSLFPEYFDW